MSPQTKTRRKLVVDAQPGLPLNVPSSGELIVPVLPGPRAIEDEGFPFEALSDIAELESWRKEINRPLSHIHKWWAQRLGTVFRAVVLGALAPKGSDILDLFYRSVRIPDAVVFDPFMGSGTTVMEAVKLGARAVGRDINPVAYFLVRNALAAHDRRTVLQTFEAIRHDVAETIKSFYVARLPSGELVPVLYYFWVKTLPCPACRAPVDLFSSRVFAQNAYPKRVPEARATCPGCGDVNTVRYDATEATCSSCRTLYDPSQGAARGQKAQCPCCSHEFPIAKTVRERETPPDHRMYAKLVLLADGKKAYLPADDFDRNLYAKTEGMLSERPNAFPVASIAPGHNTNQALNYNYRQWHEFFNARQLLGLSILGERIQKINDPILRDLFTCLFSGALEFNNMFASYKGEGTGAVRHMFNHHILKPERVPLEANLWGTSKSSGAFSTMFESRILRALDYADHPFELRQSQTNGTKASEKVYGLSAPIGLDRADTFAQFASGKRLYLSCGDSSRTDIEAGSVDVVVSDPPFFDNVHYSQLADFFFVWQRHLLGTEGAFGSTSTRAPEEVQNSDGDVFTERLGAVWAESHRVLKSDGLLVFSYHHSRGEGWRSILQALMDAGFAIVAAHPIKAEMSGATPKHQAKEPIDLDIIVVCRKREGVPKRKEADDLWKAVGPIATDQVRRLIASGRSLSRNDVRIIVMGQLLRQLSIVESTAAAVASLDAVEHEIEGLILALCDERNTKE